MPLASPLALLLVANALAIDADPFEPSGSMASGNGGLQLESPVLGSEGPAFGLLASFAQNPVVYDFSDGRQQVAMAGALPTTIYGGYTYKDRFRVDLFVPAYAWAEVSQRVVGTGYRGAAFGDLRLQGTVPVWQLDERFSVALIPRLGLPTGSRNALLRRGFSAGLLAAVGGEFDDLSLGYAANLGFTGSGVDRLAGVSSGSSLEAQAGAWYRPSRSFRLGAELTMTSSVVAVQQDAFNTVSNLQLFAQSTLPSGLGLTVGAGPGLSGVGAPEYRVFAGLSWTRLAGDRDHDGLVDSADACPDQPEDLDGFEDADGCPDLDNDDDGVLDVDDTCLNEAEDPDGFADEDGCPDPDNDGDGLLDADDSCPDAAGAAEAKGCPDTDGDGVFDDLDACPEKVGSAEAKGCPDSDGDGVSDDLDACQGQAGPSDELARVADGCPKDVYLAADRVGLSDAIDFAEGGVSLEASADAVLGRVVALLQANPQLERLEVGAHTHSRGDGPEANLSLSQSRAQAVMAALIGKGIAGDRLSAKGYGQEVPLKSNRTSRGRAANERVELKILQQSEATEAVPTEVLPPASVPTEVTPEVVVPDALPVPAPSAVGQGFLSVVLKGGSWANVYVDNAKLSKSAPFTKLPLKAGEHTVWVASVQLNLDYTETITVVDGQTSTVTVSVGGSEGGEGAAPWSPAEPTPEAPAPAEPKPEATPANPWGVPSGPDDSSATPPPPPPPAPTTNDEPYQEDAPKHRGGRRSKKRKR